MQEKLKAIPTTYRGIRFRSRLEARWGAFFDSMGWAWAYEPVDLDGWIPDFEVHGRYAEVKPARSLEDLAEHVNGRQLAQAPTGTLLLGVHPFGTTVGLVMHVARALNGKNVSGAERNLLKHIEIVAHERGTEHAVEKMTKACGLKVSRSVHTVPFVVGAEMIERSWPEAMNATQYKAPRARKVPSADSGKRLLSREELADAAQGIINMLNERRAK